MTSEPESKEHSKWLPKMLSALSVSKGLGHYQSLLFATLQKAARNATQTSHAAILSQKDELLNNVRGDT